MKHYSLPISLFLAVFVLVCMQRIPRAEAAHSGDINGDFAISLNEVLRVVQVYNVGDYRCGVDTEDGFAPGSGDQSCEPHDADYAPQDWRIDLSELLRVLQMYNLGVYSDCGGTEDGFCPGVLAVSGNVQYIPGSEFGSFEAGTVLFGLFDTGTGSVRVYLVDGTSRLFVFDDGGE